MNTKTAAVALILATAVLAGCATPPPRRSVEVREPPRVYVYPRQGQSPAQMDRDRYECHVWAAKESGFDPSRHAAPPYSRVRVEPAPSSNQAVAAGAVTGAVVGAAVAGHGDAGKGAVIGAVAGGMLGAAVASGQDAEAARIEQANRGPRREGREGAGYRRALTACLDGRGYSVN